MMHKRPKVMIDSANIFMITSVAIVIAKTKNGHMCGTQCEMNIVQQQLCLCIDELIDASSAHMETLVIADVNFNIQPRYRCTLFCVVDAQNEHSMYGQVFFVVFDFEVV